MQQHFDFCKLSFLCGSEDYLKNCGSCDVKAPFDNDILAFLEELSKLLISSPEAKRFSDIVSFGFFIRKASLKQLKSQWESRLPKDCLVLGRGTVFHIAPSNVAVNFAYSLAAGLLTGNANIVRLSGKEFPQVKIITESINKVLEHFPDLKPYILLLRYEANRDINDYLSSLCSIRIIWGGDHTIDEIRKSPLPAQSHDLTFADRYSVAIISAEDYLQKDKDKTAEDFFNDTYLFDQNACSSPRIVIWTGKETDSAREIFWSKLHDFIKKRYKLQAVQAVNKLTSSCLTAVSYEGTKIIRGEDNLITRVELKKTDHNLMQFKDNSGFFFEYRCTDLEEVRVLLNNRKCQTVGYIGNRDQLVRLLSKGIRGVDRVVPIGQTSVFSLIWDGYKLTDELTRTVTVL